MVELTLRSRKVQFWDTLYLNKYVPKYCYGLEAQECRYLIYYINTAFWLAERCRLQAQYFIYGACNICMEQTLL